MTADTVVRCGSILFVKDFVYCFSIIKKAEYPVSKHFQQDIQPIDANTKDKFLPTRISHEHCVDSQNQYRFFKSFDIVSLFLLLNTMSTEGQSMRRHLPQYFASEHSLLWFTTKNFEADTA
ncbi:MAG: hypothetical protein WBB23_01795 [Desulforhopalus sp.]